MNASMNVTDVMHMDDTDADANVPIDIVHDDPNTMTNAGQAMTDAVQNQSQQQGSSPGQPMHQTDTQIPKGTVTESAVVSPILQAPICNMQDINQPGNILHKVSPDISDQIAKHTADT